MGIVKKIIWQILNFLGIGGMIQLHLKSALRENGWFKSFKTKTSIDANGEPLAWYNYSFLKFLDNRLSADLEVFEYGAGNSTLWYAKRVKSVKSVENDKKWVDLLTPKLPKNAKVVFQEIDEKQKYQQEINAENKKYDIVVVDGRRRNDCTILAIHYLTQKGIIILDNAERADYTPAKDFLKNQGFKMLEFWGIPPIVATNNCTAVFYKNENCLNI